MGALLVLIELGHILIVAQVLGHCQNIVGTILAMGFLDAKALHGNVYISAIQETGLDAQY